MRHKHDNITSGAGGIWTHPQEYRAWIICLRPVLYPPQPIKAGGMVHRMEKNRMVRDASRRLSWKTVVASMPVGKLDGASRIN
jgi:hypothetical protein